MLTHMTLDFPSLLLGASPLILGLLLKLLLDMQLWPKLIKYLSWLPTRSIFRENPPDIRGEWDVFWDSASKNFSEDRDRQKTAAIYQLHNHIYADYADYAAKDQRYRLIGKIEGAFITGIWYNPKDIHGYRGAFQLRIVSRNELNGRWLGFSTTSNEINSSLYKWTKNPS